MSLYLDTSCLLKLIWNEPESTKTQEIVAAENRVVISSLAKLEVLVQIQRRFQTQQLTKSGATELVALLASMFASAPFDFRLCPSHLMEEAEKQIQPVITSAYCRTLDRLHLAAATVFGLKRLLTNDETQARAAKALGFEVILPR